MPWSDWIQSANVVQPPAARRHVAYFEGDATSVASDRTSGVTDYGNAAAGTSYRMHSGTQYRVRDGWDFNTFLPDEFADLVLGVDYTIKPGADPTDLYRYVDYDPDDHAEVIGWDIQGPIVYDRDFDFNLGADVWIDNSTDYAEGTTDPLAVGTTFDTIDPTTPAGTVLAAPPDPGSTLSFTVGISPTVLLAGSSAVNVVMSYPLGDDPNRWPTVIVRPARWRYWKPGITPLRQYPRNDGLRGGAPSARPTSRQGTTARRTYL